MDRPRRRAEQTESHTCSSCWAEKRRVAKEKKELAAARPPRSPRPAWMPTKSYAGCWVAQSAAARLRDNNTCQHCGITSQEYGNNLDVHHIKRLYDFTSAKEANVLENLITLCRPCHCKADAASRKANGTKNLFVPRGPLRQYNKARYNSFGEFVCIFARNWKINCGDRRKPIEGESVSILMNLIYTIVPRPTYSRGLSYTADRCQVHRLSQLHAEIEADCWHFTLADSVSADTRQWASLLRTSDNKKIVSAKRTHYLDWENVDADNYVVTSTGHAGNLPATKREWNV